MGEKQRRKHFDVEYMKTIFHTVEKCYEDGKHYLLFNTEELYKAVALDIYMDAELRAMDIPFEYWYLLIVLRMMSLFSVIRDFTNLLNVHWVVLLEIFLNGVRMARKKYTIIISMIHMNMMKMGCVIVNLKKG